MPEPQQQTFTDVQPIGQTFSDVAPITPPSGPTIGPRTNKAPASVPGAQLVEDAANKLRDWANMTEEGRAQHPLQAAAGDFAARLKQMLVGGEGGGLNMKTGFLTNPVTSLLLANPGTAIDTAAGAATSATEKIGALFKGGGDAAEQAATKPGLLQHLVQKLTGTTPERIAELSQVEDKVSAAHQLAVETEASAKATAKAAFPEIKTPVELAPKYKQGGWHGDHFVTADELQPQKIPFRAAQEQYSQLALDARAAHLARIRGQITGFDEAAILAKKNELGAAMETAATAEGKLPQLAAAKKGFAEFMGNFHNKGSAIEPLLEMKPDETSKIVSHFLHPDKGARAIETLQQYGADTSSIQELLSKGATPLKIDINEAAKLRKLGEEYGPLRLAESIDQATFNRLPSSAQARLPAWSMKAKANIPLIPDAISPTIPTRFLTKRLLRSDLAKRAVSLRSLAGNP